MKTVTYDDKKYKLVPVEPTEAHMFLVPEYFRQTKINDYKAMLAAVTDQLPGVVEHSGEPIGFLYQGESAFSFVEPDAHPHILGALGAFPVFTHPAPSHPDVDEIANFIRTIDGNHQLGAGALAEKICDWLSTTPSQPSAEVLDDLEQRKREAIKSAEYLFDNAKDKLGLYLLDNLLVIKEFVKRVTNNSQPSAEALVQAALEAAVKEVESISWPIGNSGWGEGYQEGAGDVAKEAREKIRALDKQKIIDGAGK